MSVIGLIGAGVGLASSLFGAASSRKAAREQKRELARQRAADEAWYKRNYYQDYLNTVEAQNALKRVRNAWDDRTREARARQAITGGTAEQAQAVAEAGGEAMGETVGNLAAQGQQNKAAIDAQKLAMDANLSQQAAQIAENKQAAAQQLMAGGASMITSGLQSMDLKAKPETASIAVEAGKSLAELGEVKPLGDVDVPVPNFNKQAGVNIPNGIVTPAKELTAEELAKLGRKQRGY